LETLNCYNNQLATLDISTSTALKTLNCQSNNLAIVYVPPGFKVSGTYTTDPGVILTEVDTAVPGIPQVTATQPTADSVKLSWDKVAGATSYSVYRSADDGKTYLAVASNVAEITWTDTNVPNGQYVYAVRAYTGTVKGDAGTVNVKVASTTVKLAKPTGLTAAETGNGAKLTWDAVDGAAAYYIYRSADNGKTYILVSTRLAKNFNGKTPYFDDVVGKGSYTYAIRAYDAKLANATRSDAAAVTVAVTSAKLAKPTNLAATATGNGAKLTWDAVDGAAAYYIYRSADNGKTFILVSTRLAKNFNGKKPYFDDVVGSGSYIYAIRAYDSSLSKNTRSDEVTTAVTV
jgi:fibronectin type 3 domain-containing protein